MVKCPHCKQPMEKEHRCTVQSKLLLRRMESSTTFHMADFAYEKEPGWPSAEVEITRHWSGSGYGSFGNGKNWPALKVLATFPTVVPPMKVIALEKDILAILEKHGFVKNKKR